MVFKPEDFHTIHAKSTLLANEFCEIANAKFQEFLNSAQVCFSNDGKKLWSIDPVFIGSKDTHKALIINIEKL